MKFDESQPAIPSNAGKIRREPTNVPLLIATSSALVTLIPIAAHQLGLLNHLADPPGGIFASNEITESSTAHPFGIPDSLLGIASYGITLSLVLAASKQPRARKLLAIKLLADSAIASANMIRQVAVFRRICFWCTGTALCTAAMAATGRSLIAAEVEILV